MRHPRPHTWFFVLSVLLLLSAGLNPAYAQPVPRLSVAQDHRPRSAVGGQPATSRKAFLPLLAYTLPPAPTYISLAPGHNATRLPGVGDTNRTDIVQLEPATGRYTYVLRGSAIGLDATMAIDAFSVINSTRILLSFAPGNSGSYHAGDILACDGPLGIDTACSLSVFFRAADVGLDDWQGNIDALQWLPDTSVPGGGKLLLSTKGNVRLANGLSWTGNDLVLFTPGSYGLPTSGVFSIYLDGSDVGLTDAGESNLLSLAQVGDNTLYVTLANAATLPAVGGGTITANPNTIVSIQPSQIGENSHGAWSLYQDLTVFGLSSDDIGGLDIGSTQWFPPAPLSPFGVLNGSIPWDTPDGFLTDTQTALDAGASFVRFSIYWSDLQSAPGAPVSYNTSEASHIANAEEYGAHIFPTLYIGRGWMTGENSGVCSDPTDCWPMSRPPVDLGSNWDGAHGYSASYYSFVHDYISHYRGAFDYLAIENEVSTLNGAGPWYWDGTADEYLRTLKTAYKAVHDADPDVKVVDSGFPSYWWGFCIGRQYYLDGQPEGVIGPLGLAYYADFMAGGGDTGFTTSHGFYLAVSRPWPEVQANCDSFILQTLPSLGDRVDAINFHYYESPDALHTIPEFLSTEMAGSWHYSKPVLAHEMGRRQEIYAAPTDPAFGRDVFKLQVLGQSLNLAEMSWYSRPDGYKQPLWDADGVPYPGATGYSVVAQAIGSSYWIASSPSIGPNLYHYLFADNQGRNTLEFAWTVSSNVSVTFSPPPGTGTATVTDYTGTVLATYNGTFSRTVQPNAPIKVQWR